MAKINSNTIVLTISVLVPDSAEDAAAVSDTFTEELTAIVQELVGKDRLVEVIVDPK
jgi:hypothetical protein